MKRIFLPFLGLLLLNACQQPALEYADFDTFKVVSVKTSPLYDEDGWMNPEIQTMNEIGEPELAELYHIRHSHNRLVHDCNMPQHIGGQSLWHD